MKPRAGALAADEDAQALVEFAISITLLLFIVMGIIAFARIGFAYLGVEQAARAGARAAMLGQSDPEIMQAVQQAVPALPADQLEVTISPEQSQRSRGNPVEVKVGYQVTIIAPLIGAVVPNPFPVQGDVVMRYE